MDNLLSIFLFTVVMTLTPGPNNIMILFSGLNYGIRRSMPHLLGIAVGFPIMLIAVGLGLGELILQLPMLQQVIQILGMGYLLFLAFKIANAARPNKVLDNNKPLTFIQAAIFQWVNPKAWVMIFSGVGVFSSAADADIKATTLALAIGFFIVVFPCTGAWLFLGSKMQAIIKNNRYLNLFNWTMALLLVISVVPVVIQ